MAYCCNSILTGLCPSRCAERLCSKTSGTRSSSAETGEKSLDGMESKRNTLGGSFQIIADQVRGRLLFPFAPLQPASLPRPASMTDHHIRPDRPRAAPDGLERGPSWTAKRHGRHAFQTCPTGQEPSPVHRQCFEYPPLPDLFLFWFQCWSAMQPSAVSPTHLGRRRLAGFPCCCGCQKWKLWTG